MEGLGERCKKQTGWFGLWSVRWGLLLLLYAVLYIVWAALSCSCEPLPEMGVNTGEGQNLNLEPKCVPAFHDTLLLSVCLHNCSVDVHCRSLARWVAAGWAGRTAILTDKTHPVCPNFNIEFVTNFSVSEKKFLWCDKIRSLRQLLVGERRVLYADADIVPAGCISGLTEPVGELSMYRDNICYECNKFNAGLIWANPTEGHREEVLSFLTRWDHTCRTEPLARRDDQIALDHLLQNTTSPLPATRPSSEVRYMSSVLWSWRITPPILWHYTHSVRNRCKISL